MTTDDKIVYCPRCDKEFSRGKDRNANMTILNIHIELNHPEYDEQ